MTYLSPEILWLAVLLPLQVIAYLWLLRRRKKMAVRFSHITLVKAAAGKGIGWRRHVPPALLLLACGVIVVATARPTAPVTLPSKQQTVILAVDVSGSMQAADVVPNRLRASQEVAKAFVAKLPRDVRIGIVSYADSAQLVQPPTVQRQEVLAAIDRLQLQGGTAIGEGIAISLAAIFPEQSIDVSEIGVRKVATALPESRAKGRNKARNKVAQVPATAPKPVPPGSDKSAAIVLLTDGQNTMGPDPMEAAQLAASRGIKVFTVGYGTKDGEVVGPEGFSVRVQLDEETLKRVAELTRGEYFRATNGMELGKVYEGLQGRLVMERKNTEITALFTAGAALLLALGAGLSLWWFGRVA
ncbi:VWA domain-containing protein [Piscinibacter sp. XHJ-5]|uniref:VWA domain-containing protein n=1 Tax=Piscinibacter sp. XHJ-5 TaxID=3037797 RepID=UPI0024529E5D|nr:VWA domain-containing protein [Piscinibacter sp. XHJ-5]